MAYKRYVHKKGKRHGPYYYKNVRDESGRVKSIYLGKVTARGKRPLEVAIVFLVILLIVISALFFIQNRNLVLGRIAAEEAKVPFEVDQILIKVLVKAEEYIEKELRVMNIADEEIGIEVDASLADIVDVLDKGFTIKPGQTKIVRLNFSSFNNAKGIEQAPGVYIGKIIVKTDSYERDVPVVVEIESKNVLFDMNLNPVARDRKVVQGSSTTFEIRVFNLQSIESFNVGMEFFVKDTNGNTIISEKESVVVKTQASFFKTLKVPKNLKTGDYVFIAQASLGNSIGTASYLFEVEEVEEEDKAAKFIGFCRNDPLCWALSIIVLLLIFTIGAYAYFFVGVFIYEKLFGVRIPRAKKAEEARVEKPLVAGKKENPIISSFKHVSDRIRRARERRLKKKLELEKQKLELEEKEEDLKQRRLKEREKKAREKGGRRELLGKCRRLIDKGYRALNKNNLQKSDKIYTKLMDRYIKLPSDRKAEIFKEINSFYKSLLLKKQQLKREEEARKKKKEEDEKREELEKKKEQEVSLKEKVRREELRKERKKAKRKKVFDFFHNLGLVKTEREKKEIGRQRQREKEQKELEKKKREEEGKRIEEEREKQKLEEERQKEIERKKQEEEEKKKEIEKQRQREKELREQERRKREEEGKRIDAERERQKLEEERQKELEKKRQEEGEKKKEIEKQRQREKEIREQERRKREEEGKRIEEEREKQKLEAERQRELELRRRGEERKQKEEEKKKLRELEIKRKETERKRKQKEKERELRELEELKESISEKESRINKLKKDIKETISAKNSIAKEISNVEKDIEGLKNEKNILFKMYNESLGTRKQLAEEYKNRLAEWKKGYDAKVKEKSQIKEEVNQEYENKIKEIENELSGLSDKERAEQEKWKKLELKAKYKLEEREREKAVREEIKGLQIEKREIEKEFNEKKKSLGKDVDGRDIIQRQKDIDDHIRGHEKDIEELKKEISSKERALDRYENSIERLEEEKEKVKTKLMDKKKELGGLNYLASFFKFGKKVEPKEKEEQVEKERVEEEKRKKEEEARKVKLRQEMKKIRRERAFDFFHGLGLVKTEEEKRKVEMKKQREKEIEELKKRKSEEEETRRKKEAEEFEKLEKQVRGLGASEEKKGAEEKHDLEKSLKELGEIFEKRKKEKKPGIIQKLVKREKKVKPEEIKAKIEISKKREGKSRVFIKCHNLLLKADGALQNNDISKAKKLYLKTWDMYIKLEYLEKKEIYDELTALYNKLTKKH